MKLYTLSELVTINDKVLGPSEFERILREIDREKNPHFQWLLGNSIQAQVNLYMSYGGLMGWFFGQEATPEHYALMDRIIEKLSAQS